MDLTKPSWKIIAIVWGVSAYMVTGMRIFNSLFVERRLEAAIEKLPIFLSIVFTLLIITSIIIKKILAPTESIITRIDKGEQPDLTSRLKARRPINWLPVIFIVVNVFGFFIGPIALMTVAYITLGEPLFNRQNILTILYNMSIGFVSALEQILLSNLVLAKTKRKLGLTMINKLGGRDLSLTLKNILLPMSICLMIGLMIFTAGWGYLREALGGYEEQNRPQKISELTYQQGESRYLGEMGFVLFFLFGTGIILSVSYSMDNVNQIRNLKNQLEDFRRGKGDLTLRCDIAHFDELGELSSEINQFIDFLHGLLAKVKEAVAAVTHATNSLNHSLMDISQSLEGLRNSSAEVQLSSQDQISVVSDTKRVVEDILKTIDQLNKSIESQASFVEESSSSITEMTAGIMSINKTVQQAKAMSLELEKMSLQGDEKVTSVLEKMNEIARASEVVEEIVRMIFSITEQTDMLALNAAIEAAHAGESGKGFSVVAEEIRKLAEDSSNSTSDISGQITEIKQQINSGVVSSDETSKNLQKIVQEIGNQLVLISEIANAIEEQSSGVQEILSATETVVNTTQSMKNTANLQRQKNQAIQEQLEKLVKTSSVIENRVNVQIDTYQQLETLIHKIKEVFDSNQNLVSQLEDRISVFQV